MRGCLNIIFYVCITNNSNLQDHNIILEKKG